jgi:hypothetical protein
MPAFPRLSRSEQAFQTGSIQVHLNQSTNIMKGPMTQNQPDGTGGSAGLMPPGASQIIIASLSRRALCPSCAHLGGCELGIPGLMLVPQRGGVEAVTQKSKTYMVNLLGCTKDAKPLVEGFRVFSSDDASRGETYMSGPSYCAFVRQGKIQAESGNQKEAS